MKLLGLVVSARSFSLRIYFLVNHFRVVLSLISSMWVIFDFFKFLVASICKEPPLDKVSVITSTPCSENIDENYNNNLFFSWKDHHQHHVLLHIVSALNLRLMQMAFLDFILLLILSILFHSVYAHIHVSLPISYRAAREKKAEQIMLSF